MSRIIQASACFFAGAAAFLAGRALGDGQLPAAQLTLRHAADGTFLPDPHVLAQSARMELEAIPQDVWSTLAPATENFGSELPALIQPSAVPSTPQFARPVPEEKLRPVTEMPAAIAASLSQSISAIVRSNGAVRLVLADRNTTVRRSLVIGDIFEDGWKLSKIDQGSITLTKLGRSLQVPVAYSSNPKRLLPLTPLTSSAKLSTENQTVSVAKPAAGASRRRVSRRETAEN